MRETPAGPEKRPEAAKPAIRAEKRRGTLASTAPGPYAALLKEYGTRFRADVEFKEQPRQVLIGFCGIAGVTANAMLSTGTDESAAAWAVYRTLAILFLTYMGCHARDSLLIRPHPGVWRLLHAFGLVYLILLGVLLCLPQPAGRHLVASMFGARERRAPRSCELSPRRLLFATLLAEGYWARVLTWAARMFMLRDWRMIAHYAVAREVLVLLDVAGGWSAGSSVCWWETLIVHLPAAAIGLGIGWVLLGLLSCRTYDDLSPKGQRIANIAVKRFPMSKLRDKVGPYVWTYDWPRDPQRYLLSQGVWVFCLLHDVGSVLLADAVGLPDGWKRIKKVGVLLVFGIGAVPEWYAFVDGSIPRMGPNVCCLVVLTVFEYAMVGKYGGWGLRNVLPPDAWFCALAYLLLDGFAFFAYCRWYVMCDGVPERVPWWVRLARRVSWLPLLPLGRYWSV